MIDDPKNADKQNLDFADRLRRLESGTPLQDASITQGGLSIREGGDLSIYDGGGVTINDGGGVAVNDGGGISVNSGGGVTINDGGDIQVNDGGGVTLKGGGNLDVEGDVTLKASGDLTVNAGGKITVQGPVPIILTQGQYGGVAQAMLQFGGLDAILFATGSGSSVNLVLKVGSAIMQLNDQGIHLINLPTGNATNQVGIEAGGRLVKLALSGDGGDGTDPPPPSDGYVRPVGAGGISSSWQDHKNRTPPSAEPGTDYSRAYGTPVYAPAAGTITDINPNPDGAAGRYVTLRTSTDSWFRFLHLASINVTVGQSVAQSALLGAVGGSGFGSDLNYGPHLHLTFWPGPSTTQPSFSSTTDFEAYLAANP